MTTKQITVPITGMTCANCSATIEGVTGPINGSTWQNDSVTMNARKTGVLLAQPSGLTADGSGFAVTWEQN